MGSFIMFNKGETFVKEGTDLDIGQFRHWDVI